jgi:hypothetical protein
MTFDLFGTERDPSGAPLTQERLKILIKDRDIIIKKYEKQKQLLEERQKELMAKFDELCAEIDQNKIYINNVEQMLTKMNKQQEGRKSKTLTF